MCSMEKIKAWADTLSEDRLGEILVEADEYMQLCMQSTELKKEFEKSSSDSDEEMDEEAKQKKETLSVIDYFVRRLLPLLVKTILKKKTHEGSSHAICTDFLKDVLRLACAWIEFDELVLLQLLMETFSEDAKFYSARSRFSGEYSAFGYHRDAAISPSCDSPLTEEKTGAFASASKIFSKSSTYIELINFFGEECDGFQKILDRISHPGSDSLPKIKVEHVLYYLKVIEEMRRLLNEDFMEKYSLELKDAVFDLILNFTHDELKATTKTSLVSAVEFLSSILIISFSTSEVGEITEKFQLDVSLKCLDSPSLEKRLQGLQVITGLIEMVNRKEAPRYATRQYAYYGGAQSRVVLPTTKWLCSDELLTWIDEKNIVDELFGEKMHHELLKRSNEIFKFLCTKKGLTTNHIDALWSSCLGKQEEVMAASFVIISDIADSGEFTSQMMIYLMQKLCELPIKDYDTNFVTLLGEIEESCLAKGINTYPGFPMELLWKTVQDNSGATDEVFTEALQVLLRILERIRGMKIFLKYCIANLNNHTSVPQSLQVLTKLIGHYPTRVIHMGNSETVETVIASIEENHDLVNLFFADFMHYHNIASSKSKKIAAEKRDSTKYCSGYFPHLQRVRIHLNFLEYIMSHCALPLSKENLAALWECIIEKSLSLEEQTLGFQWLSSFCDKTMLEEENLEYLFKEKICSLPFVHITKAGYECFEQLFYAINLSQDKLCAGYRTFEVSDLELTGIESLWHIILTCEEEEVSDTAVTFLSSLYERLGPSLKSQQDELREDLIRKIMKELGAASSLQASAGLEQARFRIERCLMLLQRFIELFDSSAKKMTPKAAVHGEQPISICVCSENRTKKFYLPVYRGNSLQTLCEKIANSLSAGSSAKVRADDIELQYCGTPLNKSTYSYKTLRSLNINSNSTFLYKIVKSEDEEDVVDSSPRFFLANNSECFDQLFDLLDFDEVVAQKVWKLISGLPVNPDRNEQMRNINADTDWDTLLPTHSTFQLLYQLQIIQSIVAPSGLQSEKSSEESEKWCQNFDKGFNKLLTIFESYQTQITGPFSSKCLATLLNIVNILMLTAKETEDATIRYVLKDDLQDSVNFSALIQQLLNVIWDSAKESDGDNTEDGIVRYAGSLLVAILFSSPDLLPVLFDFEHLKEFVQCVTLETKSASIRQEMATGICQLCLVLSGIIKTTELDPRTCFLPLLLEFLPTIPSDSQNCTEYFAATNKLISSILCLEKDHPLIVAVQFDENQFVDQLVRLIMDHPVVEPNETAHVDLVIIGLMTLLCSILGARPEYKQSIGKEFAQHVFNRCLFEIPTTERVGVNAPPICKSPESRKAAFSLLSTLSRDCTGNYDALLALIDSIHLKSGVTYNEWNYSPAAEQRSDVGYVGVKNLGCVCYMISLLQQLFMMPKFRKGILAMPEPEDTNEDPLEDNLMYQLQVMFANLQESYRQYFDPTDFCKANKDYDGQPTDVSVQMDADEFFNMLCDKVEQGLKKSNQEKLLKNIWCGNLCSQLICQECKTNSERDEAFFTVSLDIKGKQSIIEALEFYVEGELLTGGNKYKCEKCDKKVDALMRRCLKDLPSTLILHLKRFEFNFDTMRKVKLNDYCEFPMTLNMKPYTKEGIEEMEAQQERERAALLSSDAGEGEALKETEDTPIPEEEKEEAAATEHGDDYYNYELVGILIHRGIADSGHYYSFIKLRNCDSKEAQWAEFNDEIVRPFDVQNIEKECFGGTEQIGDGRFTREVNRTRNAYMLIYERKDARSDIVETSTTEEEAENSATTSETTETQGSTENNETAGALVPLVGSQKAEENFGVSVSKNLYESVWSDNMKFLMDKKLFAAEYASFCYDLVQLHVVRENDCYDFPAANEEFERTRVLTMFFLRILVHAKGGELIEKYSQCLVQNVFDRSVPYCRWFLGLCTKSSLRSWLLECTEAEPRQAIVNLMVKSVQQVFIHEIALSEEEDEESETEFDSYTAINNMIDLTRVLPWRWRTFNEYFLFFERVASLSSAARQYLIESHVFILFLRLMHYGAVDPKQNAPKMGDKFESPNFSHALGTLALLIRGSYGFEEEEEEEEEIEDGENPYALPGAKIEVTADHFRLFTDDAFLKRLMDDKRNAEPLSSIICFLSWGCLDLTDFYQKVIKTGINDAEFEQIPTWFKVLGPFVAIEDSLQEERINFLFTACLHILDKFKKYPKFTRGLITQVFDVYEKNPMVKQWMDANRAAWTWVEKWLDMRGYRIPGLNAGKTMTPGTSSATYFRQTPSASASMKHNNQ